MKHIILLILLTLGVWAQEVGVPYVDTREAVAQSAALSPDGETFYTYANNTLTHWSLNPVKVLESVKIEDSHFSALGRVNIYMTSDRTKILFVKEQTAIGLFDLIRKQFIKKQYMKLRAVNIVDMSVITVDNDRTISQWNVSDLQEINRIKISKMTRSCDECHDSPQILLKSSNNMYVVMVTGMRAISVDLKSFKIVQEELLNDKNVYIAKDRQTIVDMYNRYSIPFLQKTLFTEYENIENDPNYIGQRDRFNLDSAAGKLYLEYDRTRNEYAFYYRDSHQLLAKLSQFKDTNWCIITQYGYFDGSSEARKYLYMKTLSGKLVPIDNTTFQKLHKQINLKD